jgi:esterase/lipase
MLKKVLICVTALWLSSCSHIWSEKVHFEPNQEVLSQKPNKEMETVVVLHGIARTNKQTHLISKRIADAGYEVYNINYPSTEYTIEELVEYLHNEFQNYKITEKPKVNIVAHSMGGLLTRAYLKKYSMKNLNRIVMISTPNHGSEVADFFKDWKIYTKIFGPAGQQLGTNDKEVQKLFSSLKNYEVSVIAGGRSMNPIFSAMLDGQDDGTVSVESTKLEGMKDHIIVPNLHGIQVYSKLDAELAISFLDNGKFDRNLINMEKRGYESPSMRF